MTQWPQNLTHWGRSCDSSAGVHVIWPSFWNGSDLWSLQSALDITLEMFLDVFGSKILHWRKMTKDCATRLWEVFSHAWELCAPKRSAPTAALAALLKHPGLGYQKIRKSLRLSWWLGGTPRILVIQPQDQKTLAVRLQLLRSSSAAALLKAKTETCNQSELSEVS